LLKSFSRQRILVVGDLMLDRYIHGSVSRICPEAPVPVVEVTSESNVPGGASNVAWNIQALGGSAVAGGIIGEDAPGGDLRRLLESRSISTAAVLPVAEARTTVKTRIIAERQQVVRVDWDNQTRTSDAALKDFCRRVEAEAANATGVIIEDYGKGVVQQAVVDTVIRAAKAAKIPTGFDPKDNRELKVNGITVATPNRKEAFHAVGRRETKVVDNPLHDAALMEVGEELLRQWSPRLLLITLGPQGMILFEGGKPPHHVPTRAREVFDVSGAGDTVIASYVLALAAGADGVEAAELSNHAAGVVVGKLGTAVCSPEELIASVRGHES